MFNGGNKLPRLGQNTSTLPAPAATTEMALGEVDNEDYSGIGEESMDVEVESAVTNGSAYRNGNSCAHRAGGMNHGKDRREWKREQGWAGQGDGDYDEDMC